VSDRLLMNEYTIQAMYVYRNIETGSRNHCCRGKAISITYLSVCACMWLPERVGVCMRLYACILAYPARKAYAPYCDVICGPLMSTIFFDIIS
jgi:hypothetical protein